MNLSDHQAMRHKVISGDVYIMRIYEHMNAWALCLLFNQCQTFLSIVLCCAFPFSVCHSELCVKLSICSQKHYPDQELHISLSLFTDGTACIYWFTYIFHIQWHTDHCFITEVIYNSTFHMWWQLLFCT